VKVIIVNILNSRFYAILEVLSNFFLLNLIWLTLCLPIVTIFPATTAMFGVVRQWQIKSDSGVFSLFFRLFKENFKQSFLIGLVWFMFAALIAFDFMLINQMGATFRYVLFSVFFLLGILITFTTIFLFPVMVQYKTSWVGVLKNSLIFSIAHLPSTLLALLVVGAMVALFLAFPAIFLILFSVGAYLIYRICHKTFLKIERLKQEQTSE
jgi:uncharacterized membrane protein YesL